MPRRSTPASKTDDARFPIRVKFEVPPACLGRDLDRLNAWLATNVGSGRYAVHSAPRIGGDAVAVHLFNVVDARKLQELRDIEDIGHAIGMLKGPRTRGRKPKV